MHPVGGQIGASALELVGCFPSMNPRTLDRVSSLNCVCSVSWASCESAGLAPRRRRLLLLLSEERLGWTCQRGRGGIETVEVAAAAAVVVVVVVVEILVQIDDAAAVHQRKEDVDSSSEEDCSV